jgi:hypothetical protein
VVELELLILAVARALVAALVREGVSVEEARRSLECFLE